MFKKDSKKDVVQEANRAAVKPLSPTMRLVLAALFVALITICNSYLTVRIGTQFKFSITVMVYFLAGYVLGGPLGFVVGFAGDLLGWLILPDGAFNPVISVASGLYCLIPGLAFGLRRPFKREIGFWGFLLRGVISYVICYLLCTVLLTSYGIWLYTSYIQGKYQTLIAWLLYRAAVQAPNTVVNLVLTLVLYFPLKKIKPLNVYLN